MNTDRIDFISDYCDRWCGRCAFTERCSNFAVRVAEQMCDGDFNAALQLAVGHPHPVDGRPEHEGDAAFMDDFADYVATAGETAEALRQERAERSSIESQPIMRAIRRYARLTLAWLRAHHDGLAAGGDPVVREALEVIGWDLTLIGAKLARAFFSRGLSTTIGGPPDDLVQNDWNGSAKVALISLERSEAAWLTLIAATPDPMPGTLADALAGLRRAVCIEFPDAPSFVRPGFDERR